MRARSGSTRLRRERKGKPAARRRRKAGDLHGDGSAAELNPALQRRSDSSSVNRIGRGDSPRAAQVDFDWDAAARVPPGRERRGRGRGKQTSVGGTPKERRQVRSTLPASSPTGASFRG